MHLERGIILPLSTDSLGVMSQVNVSKPSRCSAYGNCAEMLPTRLKIRCFPEACDERVRYAPFPSLLPGPPHETKAPNS